MNEKVQVNLRISDGAALLFERLCEKTVRGKGDMMEFLIVQEARKEGIVPGFELPDAAASKGEFLPIE